MSDYNSGPVNNWLSPQDLIKFKHLTELVTTPSVKLTIGNIKHITDKLTLFSYNNVIQKNDKTLRGNANLHTLLVSLYERLCLEKTTLTKNDISLVSELYHDLYKKNIVTTYRRKTFYIKKAIRSLSIINSFFVLALSSLIYLITLLVFFKLCTHGFDIANSILFSTEFLKANPVNNINMSLLTMLATVITSYQYVHLKVTHVSQIVWDTVATWLINVR